MPRFLIVTGTLSVIGGFPIIEAIISGSAVWLTFSHAQLSDRLAAYARKGSKPVECVRFERLYYIGKELTWLALFHPVSYLEILSCAIKKQLIC